MTDVRSALLYGVDQLKHCTDNATAEARLLLSFVINKPTSSIVAWPEAALEPEQTDAFRSFIKRRNNGEPIAYITGEHDFWSHTLKVSRATLIPRADTEVLVEAALRLIDENNYESLLDLGTGSGAIALAIGSECRELEIVAIDSSSDALKVAEHNLSATGVKNVHFLQSDWFLSVPKQSFDLIVSNPPYIPENDEHLNDIGLKYEPISALSSGDDGLDDIRHIVVNSRDWLSEDGHLVLEHGYNQSESVQALLTKAGYSHIQSINDYAGQVRVTFAHR